MDVTGDRKRSLTKCESASCIINIIYIIAIIYGKSVLKNVNKKNDLNINFFDSLLEKSCIFAAENFKNISE